MVCLFKDGGALLFALSKGVLEGEQTGTVSSLEVRKALKTLPRTRPRRLSVRKVHTAGYIRDK